MLLSNVLCADVVEESVKEIPKDGAVIPAWHSGRFNTTGTGRGTTAETVQRNNNPSVSLYNVLS